MKNYILSAFIVIAAMSCEKKSTEIVSSQTTAPDSVTVPESNEPIEPSTLQTCYFSANGKDSVFVSLDDNLGTITGKMRFKNFEKDSSFGDVIGTQNGDTIKLNYTFQAEGTTSDREIYFLKKDGVLIEGIGEHKTEGNKDLYANPSQLKYEGIALKQVDCNGFEKKFIVK
ncbi:hypothetical protein [Kaistella montana]|uniref:Lipoprotein n=1 Tax=Kaistella montana TaxID=1849733 RepID=A0ABW5K8N2_9FLAO|nr:hypothetical protein [Kaistella montana]MCQ4034820.1 hypothetical protein [Kaistella montana]